MIIVSSIILILLVVLLALIATVRPRRDATSWFELERREKAGDDSAKAIIRREKLLSDVISLLEVFERLVLAVIAFVSVASFGWFGGIMLVLLVVLLHGALGRWNVVHTYGQSLYEKYETSLINFVEGAGLLMAFVRLRPGVGGEFKLSSREELKHLVEQSHEHILAPGQKRRLIHGLDFDDRRVSEIMTPRAAIDSISHTELLGPLALHDLHKTGHSRFPVIDGDLDHVVGVLHIQDLLTVDSGKGSTTVEKAMEKRVFYIRGDQTLAEAFTAFIKTRHHLFIVINELRETVGVVSLEDVVEALLGEKIVDEFDAHEDASAVAARKTRGFNTPPRAIDV